MKVTFEFDTDSENFSRCEYNRVLLANDMAMCIDEIASQLRSWYKYDNREEIPIEEVYDKLFNIITECVSLEKLGY